MEHKMAAEVESIVNELEKKNNENVAKIKEEAKKLIITARSEIRGDMDNMTTMLEYDRISARNEMEENKKSIDKISGDVAGLGRGKYLIGY